MAVVLTVASARSCNIQVPSFAMQQGARLSHFSCDDLSSSCCAGLQDVEQLLEVKGQGKGPGDRGITKILKKDLIGTCGRADQVNLYNCTVYTIPQLVPAGKEGKARDLIQAKGCPYTSVSSGTDGSGQCSLTVRGGPNNGTHQIDDVSTGCCAATQDVLDDAHAAGLARQDRPDCGMIGACGKQDQQSMLKWVEKMQRVEAKEEEAKEKEEGAEFKKKSLAEVLLLESYFTLGGSQDMLASLMTSEVEDDATEDSATEDGSQIMTGLLGFVAGAAVTGLGVTVLRRKSPSQDEYNQIVA